MNFVRSNRNTTAFVEHSNGQVVLTCSTNENALRQYLDSTADVSAASLVGAVLASRCQAAGITSLHFNEDEYENREQSKRLDAFLSEFEEGGIELEEIESQAHQLEDNLQGVDYDHVKANEIDQLKEAAKERAKIEETVLMMNNQPFQPKNIKVLPDGRAQLASTGVMIQPKVIPDEEIAFEQEQDRRRRSVYAVKPPNVNRKPSKTKLVFAE